MLELFQNLLNLLKINIYDPLIEAFTNNEIINNFIDFVNKVFSSIFQNSIDLNINNIVSLIAVILLIVVVIIIVNFFIFSFEFIKELLMMDEATPSKKRKGRK